MFELSSQSKVSELQAESPAMLEALMGTGIFREGDDPDVTIDDLCMGFALNPVIILNMLAVARAKEIPSDIDVSELDAMTLTQVVENIESVHHVYLREALPLLEQLTGRVASVHGDTDIRLKQLHGLIERLCTDLENHMLHEEEALFQIVRDMESDGDVRPTRCGEAVGGPILCMENEHDIARGALAQIRQLTDHYAVPGHACMTYRRMIDELVRFDKDMLVHMHKEDKVLFPRSIKAQKLQRLRK